MEWTRDAPTVNFLLKQTRRLIRHAILIIEAEYLGDRLMDNREITKTVYNYLKF